MVDDTTTHTGIRLGDFELDRVVGAGGQGEVWRGRSTVSGAPVAVKVVRSAARADFWREAAALARLDHRHIVRLYEIIEIDEAAALASQGRLPRATPCVVTEWLEAPTAERAGPWTLERLLPTALALLDALSSAHARGLLHLDLKPGNVLIDTEGMPVLIDFGLARSGDEGERGVCGTPGFMAPETFRADHGPVGPWSDLFGLGATLFTLLTGRLPFGGHDPTSRLQATLQAPMPGVPGPPDFATWLERLLERDARRRFRHAAHAAAELARLHLERAAGLETLDRALDPNTLPALSSLFISSEAGGAWLAPSQAPAQRDGAPMRPLPGWRRASERGRTALPAGVGAGLLTLRILPFIGREREREALWAALRAVRQTGGARLRVVEGGRGLGKSRLLRWLVERSSELGVATGLFVASPAGHSTPRSGLIEALRGHHQHTARRDTDAMCAELAALGLDDFESRALAELLVGDITLDDLEPGLIDKLVERWLEGQAVRQPVVVVLDDAERAPAAVRLLARLSRRDDLALLVVLASSEALEVKADTEARLRIGPLPDAEANYALEAAFGLAPSLSLELLSAADNRFDEALTLFRAWLEADLLEHSRDGLRLRTTRPRDDLAEARLAGLSLEAVEIAAALGLAGPFALAQWQTLAAQLAGLAPELSARQLEALLRREAVLEGSAGIHWLDRRLLDAIVARCQGTSRWQAIHARCLEHAQPRSAARILHLIEAGQALQAWQECDAMLDTRRPDCMPMQVFEQLRLVKLAGVALDRAGVPPDDMRRGQLLYHESSVLSVHWLQAALERAEALLQAVERHGWHAMRAPALNRHGHALYPLGRLDEARDSLEQALTLVRDDEPALRRQIELNLGYVAELTGHQDEAIVLYERVIECARRHDHAKHLERAQIMFACVIAEHFGRQREALEIALEILERSPWIHTRTLAHCVAGSTLRWLGELDASTEHFERWRELRHRQGGSSEMATLHLAINRVLSGDIEGARALCAPELDRLERKGHRHILATAHAVLAVCATQERRRERAEHHLERFEASIGAVQAFDFKLLAEHARPQAEAAGWHDVAERCARIAAQHDCVQG